MITPSLVHLYSKVMISGTVTGLLQNMSYSVSLKLAFVSYSY